MSLVLLHHETIPQFGLLHVRKMVNWPVGREINDWSRVCVGEGGEGRGIKMKEK